MTIQVELHIHSAPDTLEHSLDKLQQYIDWQFFIHKGEKFAEIKIFSSNMNLDEHTVHIESISGQPSLMSIDHTVSSYCYEVHFKVKKIPSGDETSNYELIYNIIDASFKTFCTPQTSGSMEYIVDPNVKSFVPICPAADCISEASKAIEADIEELSRKVEMLSDQIGYLVSKL